MAEQKSIARRGCYEPENKRHIGKETHSYGDRPGTTGNPGEGFPETAEAAIPATVSIVAAITTAAASATAAVGASVESKLVPAAAASLPGHHLHLRGHPENHRSAVFQYLGSRLHREADCRLRQGIAASRLPHAVCGAPCQLLWRADRLRRDRHWPRRASRSVAAPGSLLWPAAEHHLLPDGHLARLSLLLRLCYRLCFLLDHTDSRRTALYLPG